MPEFSAPQTFTIPEDASAVDSVFAFAKTKPAAVVLQAQSRKCMGRCHCRRFRRSGDCRRQGPDRDRGVQAGRSRRPHVGDSLRMAARRLRHLGGRRRDGSDLRNLRSRAGSLDFSRTPKQSTSSSRTTHMPATVKDVAAAAPALRTVYQIDAAAGR